MLAANINLVVGKNGSGKSNFLDAVYYLAVGKSFKKYVEGTNIDWNSNLNFAKIASVLDLSPDKKLDIIFSNVNERNYKKYLVNDVSKTRNSFISHFKVVLFTPHTLDIISGEPDLRRGELDDFLTAIDPKYGVILSQYRTYVKNRNHLLQRIREGKAHSKELDYWNTGLVNLGSSILEYRTSHLKQLITTMHGLAQKLFAINKVDFDFQYISKINDLALNGDYKTAFANKIDENQNKEVAAGLTLYGPHRDDFDLLFKQKSLKIFGSRGQQRLGIMILKLAMWQYLKDNFALPPVILLDDVFSELDDQNQNKLEKILLNLDTQIIISCIDKSRINQEIVAKAKDINLD